MRLPKEFKLSKSDCKWMYNAHGHIEPYPAKLEGLEDPITSNVLCLLNGRINLTMIRAPLKLLASSSENLEKKIKIMLLAEANKVLYLQTDDRLFMFHNRQLDMSIILLAYLYDKYHAKEEKKIFYKWQYLYLSEAGYDEKRIRGTYIRRYLYLGGLSKRDLNAIEKQHPHNVSSKNDYDFRYNYVKAEDGFAEFDAEYAKMKRNAAALAKRTAKSAAFKKYAEEREGDFRYLVFDHDEMVGRENRFYSADVGRNIAKFKRKIGGR